MKFNEKLMKLRKQNAWSQEEFADKLNVSRQTVSKWELGQTTPEMDKIVEMSKLFNVTVDELTKEEEWNEKNNYETMNASNKKETNWRPIIIIAILIIALMASVYYLTIGFIGKKATGIIDKSMGVFDLITDKAKEQIEKGDEIKDIASQVKEQYEKAVSQQHNSEDIYSHNHLFEHLYTGVMNGFHVKNAINEVITINQKGDKKITVIYGNINTQDINQIASITGELTTQNDYLLSYDYDTDGYICTIHISKI